MQSEDRVQPVHDAIGLFFSLAVLNLVGLITPGPLSFLFAQYPLRGDARGAFWFSAGILGSDIVLLTILGVGLSKYLRSDTFDAIIATFGGFFLAWNGLTLSRSTRIQHSTGASGSIRSPISNLAVGFFATILSTTYWLWWATVGLTFIGKAVSLGRNGFVALVVGIIAPTCLWLGVLYIAISRGANIYSPAAIILVRRLCGFALIGFAIWFLCKGIFGFLGIAQLLENRS